LLLLQLYLLLLHVQLLLMPHINFLLLLQHLMMKSLLVMLRVCCGVSEHVLKPFADRVAQHLESISKTVPTNQNSAHGIYD